MAKLKAVAYTNATDPPGFAGELFDERRTGQLREGGVEFQHERRIDAHRFHGRQSRRKRLEEQGSPIRTEHGERMGIEGDRGSGGTVGGGVQEGRANHVLMTQVHAVKHPEREAPPPGARRQLMGMTDNDHGSLLR